MALRLIEMVSQEKDGAVIGLYYDSVAIGLWVVLLAGLVGIIVLLRKG